MLDDELVEEAFRHSDAKTKREFVDNHKRGGIRELREEFDPPGLRPQGAAGRPLKLYLVDTSVCISYMRDEENGATRRFAEISESAYPFAISGVIYQEVL